MASLVICDLDGTVADTTARAYQASKLFPFKSDYWWTAFMDPDKVGLDTVISGSNEALIILKSRGHEIIYLSGRPDYMADATMYWLHDHKFPQGKIILRNRRINPERTTDIKRRIIADLLRRSHKIEWAFDDEVDNIFMLAKFPIKNIEFVRSNDNMWWRNFIFKKLG